MRFLKTVLSKAKGFKKSLRLAVGAVASTALKLVAATLREARRFKRTLILSGIILAGIVIVIAFYIGTSLRTRTYSVAYIGRYQRDKFDLLHEVALRKYIDELNAELKGVKLELQAFNNEGQVTKSQEIYKRISENDKFIVVIDNTWGSELQSVAGFIREKRIPVIAINADKQSQDFANNVVFLGHDDFVPRSVTNFSTNILGEKRIIFIAEAEQAFASTKVFEEELKRSGVEVTSFTVNSSRVDPLELKALIGNLDFEVEQRQQRQEKVTVIVNTHSFWGPEIIKHLDATTNGVTIVGGPYISDLYDVNDFGQNNRDNRLIVLTSAVDVVPNKLYGDLKELSYSEPEATRILNTQLFVKRCLDAMSIIRGVFIDESDQNTKASVSRSDVNRFFQNKLVANGYIGKHDLYAFDENLLMSNDQTFEEHIQGKESSYPKQLNSKGQVIPNVYFGIEIINVSNINITNRTFHADFVYWVEYDKGYPDVDKYIQFRNEKKEDSAPETTLTEMSGSSIYKLYKKSADFGIDVDFRKYPFDIQELKIELALIIPSDQARFSFDHASFNDSKGRGEKFSLNDWYMEDLYVSVDNFIPTLPRGGPSFVTKEPRKFKTLTVRMPIHRRLIGLHLTIILPLIMIGFAAIAILFIRDTSFAYIGEVTSAIFLSIVAYSIGFAELTPRSNVLTIADMLFYFTFFTVFLIFLKVILFNSNLISKHVKSWASKRATLIGFAAFTVYCLTVIVILVSGRNI